jgi:DNA-binding MarR family transcriptional regulator
MRDDDPIHQSLLLMLKLTEFGHVIVESVTEALGGEEVTDNASLLVLVQLELHGSLRPSAITEITGLTSGGVTKVLTRLEDKGLIRRRLGAFPEDGRAVEVSLTSRGSAVARTYGNMIASRLPQASELIEEMYRLATQVTDPRVSS